MSGYGRPYQLCYIAADGRKKVYRDFTNRESAEKVLDWMLTEPIGRTAGVGGVVIGGPGCPPEAWNACWLEEIPVSHIHLA